MTLVIERTFAKRNEGTISNVRLECDVKRVTLDGVELPDSSVEYLLTFALQSLQDAYAGAKNLDEAKAMFAKKYEKLVAGKIGVREAGESISDEVRIARRIMMELIKEKSPESAKKLRAMDEAERFAKLDANIEKNAAIVAPKVTAELKRLADERKAKKLLANELSFEL